MNHKLSRLLFNIGLALAAILILAWSFLQKDWVAWCGVGVFVLALIQQALFDHCPYCGEWFHFRAKAPDFCPRCGKDLKGKNK